MRKTIPSLNWLRVFEAAAKLESFARAAEQLNMSTSAVSQQIKALESHFGERLFERGSRNVVLTDVGYAFLPSVRQSLKMVEESANSLFDKSVGQHLSVQASLIFATMWLSHRLPDFSSEHPNVQLHLSGSYSDIDHRHAGAELAIIFGPVSRKWGQCDRLFDENIYAVGHRDLVASIKSLDDLMSHRFIQIPTHHINWNQMLHRVGVENIPKQNLCFTDSTQIALSMARSGYGLALARSPVTDCEIAHLGLERCKLLPILNSTEAYYLVYRNLEGLSNSARTFRSWLLAAVS